jgi:hypothetical protein
VWDVSLYLTYINHGLPRGFKEWQNFNPVGSSGREGDGVATVDDKIATGSVSIVIML